MPILDARGNPINTARLQDEIAFASISSIRNPFREGVAGNLTPQRLARILLEVDQTNHPTDYLKLAEEMEERDPHYRSVLNNSRKVAVQQLPIMVKAASDDTDDVERAEETQAMLDAPALTDGLFHMLDALGKGYSAVEIMWRRDVDRWDPIEYKWRDPNFFRFDRDSGEELRLRTDEDSVDGVPLEPCKFVVHRPVMKSGLTIRGGLARVVAALHLYKSFALKDWMVFAEVFGMPLRVGKYSTAQNNEADIATLRTAVANIGTDAAAVIPQSMMIEFIEASKVGDGKGLFSVLTDWLDKQVSKAVLGQTMTTDEGSSLSQASVHEEVRQDIKKSDARQLSNTLNLQLVKPFNDLNFGPPPSGIYPIAALVIEEDEDLLSFSQSLTPFIDRGLRVEQSAVRDKFKLQEPDEDAEILQPQGAGAQSEAPPQ